MKKTVEVTETDIRDGAKFNCRECPVARAASRAFGVKVVVGERWATILPNDVTRRRYTVLPTAVQGFILAFDTGRDVEPFSFELEFPDA